MISFELDQEQLMLKEAIERFVADRISKVYRDSDEDRCIPKDIVEAGWEFGLLPTAIPERFGGLGEYSVVTGAVAMEAFAFGDLAIALNIMEPALVAVPLILAGTEIQKERYLPRFCGHEAPRVSAALTEPNIRFDPRNLRTCAEQDGDEYVLNGMKSTVPLAPDAELLLIYCQENGRTQAFLVPQDTEGLELGTREQLMGIRALPTHSIALNECRVPKGNKLGGEQGIDFDLILNHSRVSLAAAATGVAAAAYQYARQYAKQRVQFGEPIAHRQSIAFMLAEMAIDVDAARLLVWETAWSLDQGTDATRQSAVMKNFVDSMVVDVADRAVQTLGGYGYIREFPAELWLRNARGFVSFDGLAMV